MSFKIAPCSLINPLPEITQKEFDEVNFVLTWFRRDYQVTCTWEKLLLTAKVDIRYRDYIKQQYAMAGWETIMGDGGIELLVIKP